MEALEPKPVTGPLAVVDIGVHTARLQISQLLPDGAFQTLENVSQPLPLGADVYRNSQISAANARLVAAILQDYARLMQDYGVTVMKAVVTGAMREVQNVEVFLDRVRQVSGVKLEVLDEPEEIRLVFLAIKDSLNGRFGVNQRNAAVCMIGPDISQILFLERGHLCSNDTVRLGTLRIKEELGGPVSGSRLRELIDPFVMAVVNGIARVADVAKPELFIAVGSAVRALVELGRRGPAQSVMTLSRQRFRQRFDLVAGVPVAQLAARYQLTDAVASSLEPCSNMLEHFFEITAADRLIVPMISTRDALMQDLVRTRTGGVDAFLPEILSAAEHLGGKFSYDRRHARAVADLALQLFDALPDLHGLGPRARLLLELASLLHDTGFFVSSRQHHKHSYYLIRNSELPGISPEEQEVLALIARYHRRATPRAAHLEYMAQPPDRRLLVSKLAALLRVADALDRSHTQRIKGLRVDQDDDHIRLSAADYGDVTLERFGLERKADLFREVFGLKVVLATE